MLHIYIYTCFLHMSCPFFPFSVQVTLLALRGAPAGRGAAPLTAAGLPTAAEPDAATELAACRWKQLMHLFYLYKL